MTPDQREALGRKVREVWVAWAKTQPEPKPSWLKPWEELSEPDREVDRQIGEALFAMGEDSVRISLKQLVANVIDFADGIVKAVLSNPGRLIIYEPISVANAFRALAESRSTTDEENAAAAARRDVMSDVINSGNFSFTAAWVAAHKKVGG